MNDNYNLKINNIVNRSASNFFRNPNVVGFGIGNKIFGNRFSDIPSLIIYVNKKIAADNLSKEMIIPKCFNGIITDIVELNRLEKQKGEIRPAMGGLAIGNVNKKTTGTLGYAVTERKIKKNIYILSSNHVLNSEKGIQGEEIVQPSIVEGGNTKDSLIATLDKYVPIKRGELKNINDYNEVDAAIAKVGVNTVSIQQKLLMPQILKGPSIIDTTTVASGKVVWKRGYITGRTTGKVITFNTTISLDIPNLHREYYKGQIVTTGMSEGGDSGALGVTEEENKAFGLLMGGNKNKTIFNPIDRVLDLLEVELAKPFDETPL